MESALNVFDNLSALTLPALLSWLTIGESEVLLQWRQLAREEAARSPHAVVKLMDDSCRIIFASDSHEALLGYLPDRIMGKKLSTLIAPEDRSHSELAIQNAVLTTYSVDIRFRHRNSANDYVAMRRKTWGLPGDSKSKYYVMTKSVRIS